MESARPTTPCTGVIAGITERHLHQPLHRHPGLDPGSRTTEPQITHEQNSGAVGLDPGSGAGVTEFCWLN
ncbi:hypothetical protein, partial [uncultured Spongiibacter sp.]|uniref:hypothetical protein n=1 Tax=uncultured Spongiibacter sp. TaxID=870896 RepID=UPI0025994E79